MTAYVALCYSYIITLDAGMDADAISHFNKMKVVHHNMIMKQEGELLNEILSGGIESGELKPISKIEMDTLIFVLLSSLHGLKHEMVLDNNFDNIEPTVNTLTSMVIRGLKK